MTAPDSPAGDALPTPHSDTRTPWRPNLSDPFLFNRALFMAAFVWGLGEATLFFIVPDVLLTWAATRSLRSAMQATLVALAGALVGGAAVVAFAHAWPDTARTILLHIPGINAHLLERVSGQVDELNLLAILFGPLKGIPYKIYAVEWGVRGGALLPFLLISIPARWVRFALTAVIARAIARLLEPLTRRRAGRETLILAFIWIAFYVFYFTRFGW
jgi:membrane protein YqaA with SNARE-associated domain